MKVYGLAIAVMLFAQQQDCQVKMAGTKASIKKQVDEKIETLLVGGLHDYFPNAQRINLDRTDIIFIDTGVQHVTGKFLLKLAPDIESELGQFQQERRSLMGIMAEAFGGMPYRAVEFGFNRRLCVEDTPGPSSALVYQIQTGQVDRQVYLFEAPPPASCQISQSKQQTQPQLGLVDPLGPMPAVFPTDSSLPPAPGSSK